VWETKGNWDEMMEVVLGENGEEEEWLKVERLRNANYKRMEENKEGMNKNESEE